MKKVTFKEGDLFFIDDITLGKIRKKVFSFGDNKRVGKLIYISSLFKDMIGFIPSEDAFSLPPENLNDMKFLSSVIYTGNSELKNGNWEIIGYQATTDEEMLLTKRRVGNIIMIKDDEIRVCTEEDYQNYTNQGIAGLGAVHYLLINL